MLAVTACERNAGRKFHEYLQRYKAEIQGAKRAVRIHHCRKTDQTTLGDAVFVPESDVHHVLAAEVMLAVSHAIEDLAGDIGRGELIAAVQDFAFFEPHRDRYRLLAGKVDAVRVWGAGTPPKKCPGVDFVVAEEPKIRRYWLVLFDSPTCRAILLCRQINQTQTFANKKFVGFYSFNPFLVQSIRRRFNLLSCGLTKIVQLLEKSYPLPDLKPGDIRF